MNVGTILLWCVGLGCGLATIYALHRLALRLEERGQLYYLYKQPRGGAGGAFVALREVVEPQAAHVRHVREHASEDDDAGRGHA